MSKNVTMANQENGPGMVPQNGKRPSTSMNRLAEIYRSRLFAKEYGFYDGIWALDCPLLSNGGSEQATEIFKLPRDISSKNELLVSARTLALKDIILI